MFDDLIGHSTGNHVLLSLHALFSVSDVTL